MIEFAAVVVAVAFVVLVGYVIPTVLQLRRTVMQSERLLAQLNHELPALLKALKGTSEDVHAITTQAREGLDQASMLFKAMGEMGQTIHRVHGIVRGKGSAVVLRLASLLAGVRAASSTIKQRRHHKEGGK
ncbi:MAG: DUF948 domain-containing protein [Nitrospirae bacterium]|nr:MAG: DUF948 domain-containing protein [Nitrospirota bacterium]